MRTTNLAALAALMVMTTACSRQTSEHSEPVAADSAPAGTAIADIDTERLINAAKTPEEWLSYGGSYDEQRFSGLDQVNRENVGGLGVAWTYDLATSRGVEATPIVVDGVMYLTGAWSIVYALDARTGKELWVYNPEVSGEDAVKGCCDVINRGVAVYGGKVFVGVFDGRLEALDAATGEVVWSTVTVDQSKPYTITGAPRVVKDKVLIGNGGAEYGVRGYVSAYDTNSGELVWRFYTTPNPNKKPDGAASDAILAELANDTWGDDGAWTTDGGGGTAWDAIVYDSVNDNVLIGVGNGSPWNAETRDPNSDGDNLFLSSIVAVDADSGEYRWHFQTTPRDQWDYTATQPIILAELPLGENGADRRVVMQAPKNGFFYVLDAATGEFISGEAFAPMTWATGLDENGRPIENPAARDIDSGFLAVPGPPGAHSWHPMAYSPQTSLVYIPTMFNAQPLQQNRDGKRPGTRWNLDYNLAAGIPPSYPAGTMDAIRAESKGALVAWDPVKQEAAWTVDHIEAANGGVLATASGLVFQGAMRGEFAAYVAATGQKLWSHDLKSGAAAAPSTFEIDGEQYIAIATGWGTNWALSSGHLWGESVPPDVGRVVAFKLGGNGVIPEPMVSPVVRTPKADAFGDDARVMNGLNRYSDNCMVCHGPFAISAGVIPDLRWSVMAASPDAWKSIVLDGTLSSRGMASFKQQITPQEAEDIRAYVLSQAWLAVANGDADEPTSQ